MDDNTPTTPPSRDRDRPVRDSLIGSKLGPYQVLECIGEGGMGVVYLAERHEPIRQRVAVKVIKPGMDSESIIARFKAERHALERMSHPNIAKVLDAGATDRGLPYFVMEYVPGDPITVHADEARLSIEERIDLFIAVCEAVQHAHHKGVIHRDLKPSNILVSLEGQQRTPKIIDFGVARAVDAARAEGDVFTHHGQLIGTIEYMSPEQAEMGSQDIDTRTDVYALGVILYELLTGVLPFEPKTLREAGLDAIHRIIRDIDPPIPSKRLRSLPPTGGGSTVDLVSKSRGIDSRRLSRLLRNDLDWVVMKCLEKRRDRRYDTPSALAMDLRRFLAGETVLTGPPRLTYHFGKFVNRHRAGVTTSALVLLALVVGFVVTFVQWQRAEASERQAREIATQLISVFHDKVLDLPGSIRARRDLLDIASAHLEQQRNSSSLDGNALLVLADGYDKLGDVAGGLRTPNVGDIDTAMRHYQTARSIRESLLERDHGNSEAIIGLSRSAQNIGRIFRQREDLGESIREYRSGLAMLDRLVAKDRESVDARISEIDLRVALWQAMARLRSGQDRDEMLDLLTAADQMAINLDRELSAEHPKKRSARNAHAHVLHALGEHFNEERDAVRAVSHLRRATEIRESIFDSDPVNARFRRSAAGSAFMLGFVAIGSRTGEDFAQPLATARRHFEFLVEADPADVEARQRLAQVYEFLSSLASRSGEPEQALHFVRLAVQQSEIVHLHSGSAGALRNLALQQRRLAALLASPAIGRYEEATAVFENGHRSYDQFLRSSGNLDAGAQLLASYLKLRTERMVVIEETGTVRDGAMRDAWRRFRGQIDQTAGWLDAESIESPSTSIQGLREALNLSREACEARLGDVQPPTS